jgi:hypothetical protein
MPSSPSPPHYFPADRWMSHLKTTYSRYSPPQCFLHAQRPHRSNEDTVYKIDSQMDLQVYSTVSYKFSLIQLCGFPQNLHIVSLFICHFIHISNLTGNFTAYIFVSKCPAHETSYAQQVLTNDISIPPFDSVS